MTNWVNPGVGVGVGGWEGSQNQLKLFLKVYALAKKNQLFYSFCAAFKASQKLVVLASAYV